jgi:phosphoribosylanthranilate isomerase
MPTVKEIKVCCIKSLEEAVLALEHGASTLGLVSHMPSGPGVIGDEQIDQILKQLPADAISVLLTSLTTARQIEEQHRRLPAQRIQLVDELSVEELISLRDALPEVELMQVIHVQEEADIHLSVKLAEHVDFILLDSGNPKAEKKTLGGTGETHDWDISRSIVERCPRPVFLAGGLNAANVRSAIDFVKPYGIDLCSGVRISDQLDKEKLSQFFAEVLAE